MNSPRLSARFTRDANGGINFHDDEVDEESDNVILRRASLGSARSMGSSITITMRDIALDSVDPQDMRKACFYFVMVGIGYLFPFSALTQPVDYWNLLFPDFNLEFPLTCIYMYTNLIMLAYLVFTGSDEEGEGRDKNGSTSSSLESRFTRRIVGGFVGQLLVLVIVPTSYFFGWSESTNTLVILGSTALAAMVTAFIDSSVIALASQYPLRVQEFFQLGIGVSTLIGSVYRDATKIAFPPDQVVSSSLLYFYSGAATIAACIVSYYKLLALPLSKACLRDKEHKDETDKAATEETNLLKPNKTSSKLPAAIAENTDPVPNIKWTVFRAIIFNEMMVLLLFMSTLALWPPLVTEIPAYQLISLQESGWYSLILLTIFSFSDCAGRLLVRYRCGLTKDNIWIAVLGRIVFLFPISQ